LTNSRAEVAREVLQRLAGGDRQEYRARIGEALEVGQHGIHGLRLHREHDDLGRVAHLRGRADGAQTRLLRPQSLDRLGDESVGSRKPARQPAIQHGAAHLAASNQQQLAHVLSPGALS